jgi:hypothetical protein
MSDNPKFCQVRLCMTRYTGKDAAGKDTFAQGHADVFLNDDGVRKGICAKHYTNMLFRAGRASNQDIVDVDGRLDAARIALLPSNGSSAVVVSTKERESIVEPYREPPVQLLSILDDLDDDEFFANHERERFDDRQ